MEGFGRHSYKDLTWHSKNVNSIKWNVNGSFISTLSSEKFVRIGQLDNNGGITVVQNIPTTIQMMQVCWHPTETNKLAICSDEKPVEFWDVRAPKAATKLTSLGGNINMAWSPSGNYVAVGNKSDYLSVYDVRTATMVKKRKMRFELNELSWTQNSDYIVAAVTQEHSGGAALISFNDDDLAELRSVTAHCASCYFLEMDRNKQIMAIGSQDFCVTLWDMNVFLPRFTMPIDVEIRSLSFSGSGEHLAVGTEDASVLICNTQTGEPVAKVPSKSKATSVGWHPSRPLIAISCEDKSCNLRLLSFPDLAL